ncbi:hypothetical protein O181_127994 [Austropuccinia psidii MF-1]|uniref:Uncharacterized protein n=1 Tax=Austropuccinia psidii MF-1 TaxID=1389203 RepID=A0A9Q3KZ28_9BASI|nr:hypothetical protein [Austropuccinia psidii MF-1]
MRPKGAARWVPNYNWTHLSQFLATNPLDPILAKNPLDTKMAIEPVGPPWNIIPAMASGNHQRPPDQLSKHSPQLKGDLSIPPCTPYSRLQQWCIYGIIYHYAPFLLNNSMVMFSGPNSTIPNQGPKIQRPFRRRTFQLISLAIHGGNQRTIQGSQSPGPAGVWLAILFRIIPRAFSEVIQSFNQLSSNQVTQYSLDNSIGPYRRQSINLYVLGPIGPIQSSTVGIQSHSSFSRWP